MNDLITRKFLDAALPKAWLFGPNMEFVEISSAADADHAIKVANEMHALGGSRHVSHTGCSPEMLEAGSRNAIEQRTLVFVSCEDGPMSPPKIKAVARIIGAVNLEIMRPGQPLKVRGNRAVVCPQRAQVNASAVPFLIAREVWFNRSRAVMDFPSYDADLKILMADLSERLASIDCKVSLAR